MWLGYAMTPEVHMFEHLVPTVWEGCRVFRGWCLTGESGSLGFIVQSHFTFTLCFLNVNAMGPARPLILPERLPCLRSSLLCQDGLYPLELWAQINPSSLQSPLSRFCITAEDERLRYKSNWIFFNIQSCLTFLLSCTEIFPSQTTWLRKTLT